MKRTFLYIYLLCGVLLATSLCRAEDITGCAKVVIDNPSQGSFLIGEIRGKDGFKANLWSSAGKRTVIDLNEKVLNANKLFMVFFDNAISWIKVYPGDEIVVSQKDGLIVTKGGNEKINQYLAKWTRESYYGCPNSLITRVAGMELMGVGYKQTEYKAQDYCSKSTVSYLAGLSDKNMSDLKVSGISDSKFLDEHVKRIKIQWIELVLYNYFSSEENPEATKLAALLKNYNLDDKWALDYPGLDDMLGFYVKMKINEEGLKIGAKSFLVDQAAVFALPEFKERFILNEMRNIDRFRWYLLFDETLKSVIPYILSDKGVSLFKTYKENYLSFLNSELNMNGKPAQNFTFEDRNNRKVSLSDYAGKYVVIDFWATWCGPCKYQIPFLRKMEREFHGKNVQFISISADKQKDRAAWVNFIESNEMNGICLITPNAFDCDFARKYAINSIPRFLLIGPDGNMLSSDFRRPSDPVFKAQLEYLLSKNN